MTLGVALCGKGFVLVAADKRETIELRYGGRHTGMTDKIYEIDHNLVALMAGPGWACSLFRAVSRKIDLHSPLEDTAVQHNLGPEIEGEYARRVKEENPSDKPDFQVLLAGFDSEKNSVLFSLSSPNFLAFPNSQWLPIGSAAQSQYFLKAIYRREASVDEMALLACFCIRETSKQDQFVGPEMDIAVVRQSGIENLAEEKVKELGAQAEGISQSIRHAFGVSS